MKIIIKNLQKKIHLNPKRIKVVVLKLLSLEGRKKSGEITICFFTDRQIRELNLFYRGRDVATDVIAFDNSVHPVRNTKFSGKKNKISNGVNKKEISADIAVSCETAIRNARIFKTTPLYEIYLYVIHGLLHILGYDDETAKQRKIMHDKATQIMDKIAAKSQIPACPAGRQILPNPCLSGRQAKSQIQNCLGFGNWDLPRYKFYSVG